MKPMWKVAALVVGSWAAAGAVALAYLFTTGLRAQPQPGAFETFAARTFRSVVIGWHARHYRNPVPASDEAMADGRAHFADHCASCHANDGGGETRMGRAFYPKTPDMRLPATQNLSDGELFYIIENGVRLTGMPAWGTGTPEGERASWHLVHFIRRLPQITPEEIAQMESMNQRSPEDIRQEIEAERFLQGGDPGSEAPRHEGGGHDATAR